MTTGGAAGRPGPMRRPSPWARVVASLVVALLVAGGAACGGGSDDDAAPAEPASGEGGSDDDAPLEVVVADETFVDASRPTPAGAETPSEPDRTLVTRIAHPTDGGPYPLVVLSHGLTGHPDEYAETIPMWAAEGFVVAAPAFPLTNREVAGAGGNAADVENQPGDVSFVIDEVLAASADADSALHGLVDPEAIGVVGHSLGGATTWAVSYDTATRDDRIDSTVIFSGLTLPMPGGELDPSTGPPLLVLHGDGEDIPADLDQAAYDEAASPKWFVTLHGGDHRLPFTDEASPWDDLVTATVFDFWHGTLGDDADPEALAHVTISATDPELSTVQHE